MPRRRPIHFAEGGMTAQIIDLAERRRAIRQRHHDQYAIGFLWPGIAIASTTFWVCFGIAAVRAWPLVRLP
jgi:hypothetical protein